MSNLKKIAAVILSLALVISISACSAKEKINPENETNSPETPLFTAGIETDSSAGFASTKYKAGDLIYFGEYPATLVSEDIEAELNKLSPEWKSFDYYSGDGSVGSMAQNSYMKYADVTYNGQKYRAVQIVEYRPEYTYKKTAVGASINGKRPQQAVNSFSLNKTYWFMYQPLAWRVLDPETGLIVCENIIDAQPYSNTVYQNGEEYYSDSSCTKPAYDYENSSIRQWLNNDENGFFNVAFSEAEKKLIKEVEVTNNGIYTPYYDTYKAEPTKEKVYLLSVKESQNDAYGLEAEAYSTFYAWIQGVELDLDYSTDSIGECTWITRTPARVSMMICEGGGLKDYTNSQYVYVSACGIRPAVQLSNLDSLEPGKDMMKEYLENS